MKRLLWVSPLVQTLLKTGGCWDHRTIGLYWSQRQFALWTHQKLSNQLAHPPFFNGLYPKVWSKWYIWLAGSFSLEWKNPQCHILWNKLSFGFFCSVCIVFSFSQKYLYLIGEFTGNMSVQWLQPATSVVRFPPGSFFCVLMCSPWSVRILCLPLTVPEPSQWLKSIFFFIPMTLSQLLLVCLQEVGYPLVMGSPAHFREPVL